MEKKASKKRSARLQATLTAFSQLKRAADQGLVDVLGLMVDSGGQAPSLDEAVALQRKWLVDRATIAAELSAFEQIADSTAVEDYLAFLEEWPEGVLRSDVESHIDDLAWHEANDLQTLEGFEKYLRQVPFGKRAAEARRRIAALQAVYEEEEAWKSAKGADSEEAYSLYLKDWPDGKYTTEATERLRALRLRRAEMEAWEEAAAADLPSSYAAYILNWPTGAHSQEAKLRIERHRSLLAQLVAYLDDRIHWLNAANINTRDAYRLYLHERPDGLHANNAKRELSRIDQLELESRDWNRAKTANTEYSIRKYLKTWPAGEHSDVARSLLRHIAKDRSSWKRAVGENTLEAYRNYLEEWPEGRYVKEAKARIEAIETEHKEHVAWKRAVGENTLEAYRNYLEEWPEGRYVKEAKEGYRKAWCKNKWHTLSKNGSYADLVDYLSRCKGTTYQEDAEKRIRLLEKRQRYARISKLFMLTFAVGLLIYKIYTNISSKLFLVTNYINSIINNIFMTINKFEHLFGLDTLPTSLLMFRIEISLFSLIVVAYAFVLLGRQWIRSRLLTRREVSSEQVEKDLRLLELLNLLHIYKLIIYIFMQFILFIIILHILISIFILKNTVIINHLFK